nr:iron-siderophore ABC transporter substrate-binding protein [Deinococcus aestuarii]
MGLAALAAVLGPSGPALAQTPSCAGKLVSHALGQTCVRGVPRRVVTLEWTYTENVLALGVQPVGAADTGGYREWVRIPAPLSAGVPDVGTRQQPSLERIRALRPDLILTSKLRATQNYAQLAAIAPTLAFDTYAPGSPYGEMRATFTIIGDVLGRPNTARQVLGNLDARLARVRGDLRAAGRAGETFVFAQAFTARGGTPTMRLFTNNSLVSEVLEKVGLVNAWNAPAQGYGFSELGLEGLAALRPRNFLYVIQQEDNVFAAPATAPLWQGLPFVREGRAYALDERTWTFGGPLSALELASGVRQRMLGRPTP